MRRLPKLIRSMRKIKKPLKNVKQVKWLLPGWVFYEYYKINKNKGSSNSKSFGQGMKAEAIRLVAFASLPIPGTYELTTTGLALIKKKIEKGDVENLTLKGFKDFIPVKTINFDKKKAAGKEAYLKLKNEGKKVYFKIFYKGK